MNLPQKLAAELVRVATVRCHCESLRQLDGSQPEPVIEMIDAALERGIAAAGRGDAVEQIEAVKELGGFGE